MSAIVATEPAVTAEKPDLGRPKRRQSEALSNAWRDSLNTMATAASAVGTGVEGIFKAPEGDEHALDTATKNGKEDATMNKKNKVEKVKIVAAEKKSATTTPRAAGSVNEVARAAGRATINLLTQPLTQLQQMSGKQAADKKKKPKIKPVVEDWIARNEIATKRCIEHDRQEFSRLGLNIEARLAWTLGWVLLHAILLWYILRERANMWPLLVTAAVALCIVVLRGPEADKEGVEYYVEMNRQIRRNNQVPTLGMIAQLKRQKKVNEAARPKADVLGTTLKHSSFPGEPMTWEPTEASQFKLRGPNYLKDRKKQPSPEALYEPFAADLLRAHQPFFDLPRSLVLPQARDHERNLPSWLPRIIVQNMWFPGTPPPLLGGGGGGGGAAGAQSPANNSKKTIKGYMVACYWRITAETVRIVKTQAEEEWPPHLRLWKRYAQQAEISPVLNGCFKGVASVDNLHERELGLPRLVKQYNAKPVLMAASALVGERQGVVKIARYDDYFEFGFNVGTDFAAMSNHALLSMKDTFPKLVLDLGWLVEGRHINDLPEGLIACMRINRVDLSLAVDIEEWLKLKSD